MRLVATMPTAWPLSGPDTRKCLLTRFPYLVIYAPLLGGLLVLAVGHQHRTPGYWRERLAALKWPRQLGKSAVAVPAPPGAFSQGFLATSPSMEQRIAASSQIR